MNYGLVFFIGWPLLTIGLIYTGNRANSAIKRHIKIIDRARGVTK